MAEAIVPSLLKLIPDLVKGEWVLASRARAELEYLKDLIEQIGHFFKKANSNEVIDEDLKASMKRMRKFLYDSADAIDDFKERGNRRWEGLVPDACDFLSRRNLASQAQEIRQMMNNYEATRRTFRELSPDLASSSSAGYQSVSIAFSAEKNNGLVGIETATGELSQLLTEDSRTPNVIFVHGTQGVGKTSLVGAVLREETVKGQFCCYVWVKDLRSCELAENKAAALMKTNAEVWYKTDEPTQHKLEPVFGCLRNGKVRWERTHLELEAVFRLLQSGEVRWVLVLDDAGSTHVFESLRSHLVQTRPSVLVTTRDSSLAFNSKIFLDSMEPPEYNIWRFKHVSLSEDDSVKLFWQKMSHMYADRSVLEKACDSILRQCEGLPLAILAVSYLLSNIKDGVDGAPRSVKWEKWSCKLGGALFRRGQDSGLIRRMVTLRMDHLHDVIGCLFYLSIFPLDRPISCSPLMQLWMAEKFFEQKGTSPFQEIAEETLNMLVDRNLFREVAKTSYGRAKTCRVHNILHQIIISKSKDDEFAMIVVDPEEVWPETVWRLSFHCKMISIKDGTNVQRLRSLLVFESLYPDCMEELLEQVSRLNVLDIQDSSLKKFPEKILRLQYLRYLSLKGTRVTKIPPGIGGLKHLETLNLKGTNVIELPESILQLQLLRHLLVYRSTGSPASSNYAKNGVKAPAQLGDLTSLQKLCLIDLDEVKRSIKQRTKWSIKQIFIGSDLNHGNRLLKELEKLKNLRRLGISNLESEHVEHLHSLLKELKKLESLHLIASARDQGILNLEVDERQVSPTLQRVHLTGQMVSLPKWILSSSLAKLVLKGSKLKEYEDDDPLRPFKGLQSLKHLDLQQVFCDVKKMKFEEREFQQLCFLGLDTFPSLESITVAEGALPALEELLLARCERLTRVPQGITYPKQLKRLVLHQMPEEFETAVRWDDAVRAHMIVFQKLWIDGAVVEDYPTDDPTDHPTDRPASSRRPIVNRK